MILRKNIVSKSLSVNVYIARIKQQGRNNNEGKADLETVVALAIGCLINWQFEETHAGVDILHIGTFSSQTSPLKSTFPSHCFGVPK